MAMDSENIKGRAYAFGTWSAIKPLRSITLRPLLALLQRTAAGDWSSTHFASFIVVPAKLAARLHSNDSGLAKSRDYLLHLSAWNGEREEYLHACARVLGPLLGAIWSHCENWPGAWRWKAFTEYVDAHEVFADAYFNAYGDATAEDVRAALRLTRALERFALEPAATDARQFRKRYERLLMELGADLAA
jgi:hypothetical protein